MKAPLTLIALSVLLSTAGHANPYQAPYAGARVGWSNFSDACFANATSCDNDDVGYGLFGGYRINRNFAVEASYLHAGEYRGNYGNDGTIDTKYDILDISPVFLLPFNDTIDAFFKFGLAYWDGENNGIDNSQENDWTWTTGLGLNYAYSRNLDVRAEYQFYNNLGDAVLAEADLHFTSIGASYRFAGPAAVVPVAAPIVEEVVEEEVIEVVPTVVPAMAATVEFPFDSSKLAHGETKKLDPIVSHLKNYPDAPVDIAAYTDSQGSAKYNDALSKRRAESVASFLETQGISRTRMNVRSFGEANPIESNTSKAGRAHNRRVEINVAEFEAM